MLNCFNLKTVLTNVYTHFSEILNDFPFPGKIILLLNVDVKYDKFRLQISEVITMFGQLACFSRRGLGLKPFSGSLSEQNQVRFRWFKDTVENRYL